MLRNKKIKYSIRGVMLLSLCGIVFLTIIVFVCATWWTGILHKTDNTAYATLQNYSLGKESSMTGELNLSARTARVVANSLGEVYQEYLLNENMTPDEALSNEQKLDDMLSIAIEHTDVFVRRNVATGAFVMLDGQYGDNDNLATVYLRAPSSSATLKDNYDLTVLRGPTRLFENQDYALEKSWSYEQVFAGKADKRFVELPQQAALKYPNADETDWGYWSAPFRLANDDVEIVTFTTPILDAQGEPIGVFGVEFSLNYLTGIMPTKGLPFTNGFFMIGMMENGQIKAKTAFTANVDGERFLIDCDENIPLKPIEITNDYEIFSTGTSEKMYVSYSTLEVYGQNSPFKDNPYYIYAFAPKSLVLQGSTNMINSFCFAVLISLLVAAISSAIISKVFASKIENLAQEVKDGDPSKPLNVSITNIREIDLLAHVFEHMRADVINYAARMATIIDLVGVPIGAFEIESKTQSVYLTDSLLKLLEIQNEKCSANHMSYDEFALILPSFNIPLQEQEISEEEVLWCGEESKKWLRISLNKQGQKVFGTVVDVTNEVLSKKKIEFERDYDLLTKLLNRNSYPTAMDELIKRYPDKKGILLFADLDNLKQTNDNYGHDAGDRYIEETARALLLFEKFGAVVGRVSGDEFIVFVHGFDTYNEVKKIIHQTLEQVRQNFITLPDNSVQMVNLSVGFSCYPDDSDNIDMLTKYADFAMFEIKNSVKGETRQFNFETYNRNSRVISKADLLERLIQECRLQFAFQPIIDVTTGEVFAYEALMRPLIREFQSPMEIFLLAKEQSKLYQLGKLTTTLILEWFQENHQKLNEIKLFINIIANQTMNAEDEKGISKLLENISDKIVMEISKEESEDEDNLASKINYIKQNGCEIAISEYNFNDKHEHFLALTLPNYIKIDIETIRDIDKNFSSQEFVKGVVAYARAKNVKVVAEGVENIDELRTIITLGVNYAQGYYLGKPNLVLNMHDEERCLEAAKIYNSLAEKNN